MQPPPASSSTGPMPQHFQPAVSAPVGLPYGPYSFPCQMYHNVPYPHNQMQMYISAPPQGYPQPTHGNTPQTPQQVVFINFIFRSFIKKHKTIYLCYLCVFQPFVQPVGSAYPTMPHPTMPSQGYPPMACGPNSFQMPMQLPPPPPNVPMQYFGPPPPQTNVRTQPQQGPIPPPNKTNINGQWENEMRAIPYHPYAQPPQSRQARHPHHFSPLQYKYLISAYNVGMLALETLARRVHDDRPQAKYARNPPYGDDVKWLLQISKKLGTQYLHQFCVCAVNSIVSPFVLHDVAIESAHYLARNNPTLVMQHLRSALTPLVQKCQQM